jgi:hypothetical protein
METIFKEGDRVYCLIYGWGNVGNVNTKRRAFPVDVVFDKGYTTSYTEDGRLGNDSDKTLSFTEYTLEGFSQERPEELPKRGDIVWIKEMDTKMYVPIIFMEAIDDNYVLSFNFMNIKIVNKDFVETKNPYANEQ